jgi:hypothetical protein
MITNLNRFKEILTDNESDNDRLGCKNMETFLKQLDFVRDSLTLSDIEALNRQATAIRNSLRGAWAHLKF